MFVTREQQKKLTDTKVKKAVRYKWFCSLKPIHDQSSCMSAQIRKGVMGERNEQGS